MEMDYHLYSLLLDFPEISVDYSERILYIYIFLYFLKSLGSSGNVQIFTGLETCFGHSNILCFYTHLIMNMFRNISVVREKCVLKAFS